MTKKEFHIKLTEQQSIVELLSQETGLSKNSIKQAMQKGAAWLENKLGIHRIRRADKVIEEGQTVHFYYDENILQIEAKIPQLIADEKDYSVWNKPAGMLSQGSKWSDHTTINRWIETQYTFTDNSQRPCFLVHRLDKATQGLILIAHKKTVASQLSAIFENREMQKHYYAKVKGELPIKFNQHLDKEPVPKPILIENNIDGKTARTFVHRINYDAEEQVSTVDIKIETGRKHQIRIHMNDYGYPLIGDRLYAKDESDDLQLQSYRLSFISPIDNEKKDYCLDLKL